MRIVSQFMCIFLRVAHKEMQLKYGILKTGGCIIANNNSKIPKSDLTNILKTISLNFLYIVAKWKEVHGTDNTKFYC